jgi:hypothetical protein
MCVVMVFMQRYFYAHHYLQLAINMAAGFSAYGIGLLWFVLTREPLGIEARMRVSRYFRASGAPES